ncbi:phosphatidate cytidylyltransferase [Corynebacterium sp. sy017]|uniref:phosphatidate cytidylyltransferase n=1 Tax=unclassified Corynebacterium TaxID=2624378 RepID=UPI0011851E4E|nr:MULTISPECIES: phosphatidate cytidylyltransferase [unclassified Corynebacterium]MBP3087854.1 phosphatidate cytidylyltransferase [Corynebacterium sp. sy017]QDZ42823.1 phosphatidate cytidylyltransferase [Corynebacterium sp. sy039]TSD92396.1 phosphatidate cytidylyltransferase [Corynebacterium sp. SY003]
MSQTVHGNIEHFPKPRNSAGRNLKAAISVGIGLGLLVFIAIFIVPFGWYPFVAVILAAATWEVHTRLRERSYVLPKWLLLAAGQLMIWLSLFFGAKGLVSAYALSVLCLMFSRLFHHGSSAAPKNYLRDTAIGVFVLTWIPLFGSFAAMLSLFNTDRASGSHFIVTFMLCVIASDTGGYIAGVMFGAHPMAPAVSPKKSWEGFIGSIIAGIFTGALSVSLLLHYNWWWGILLGGGLVICATLGDLVESQFKRELGIKDMSNLLPGHGGIMDRLDGMLPSAMVTWLLLSLITMP